jgi:hypothetical protein
MTPIVKSNPTAADAMPPKMYHNVWCVKRPRNRVLRLSARERDATTTMMMRTTPAINRTTPRIRDMPMGINILRMYTNELKKPVVLEGKYLTR